MIFHGVRYGQDSKGMNQETIPEFVVGWPGIAISTAGRCRGSRVLPMVLTRTLAARLSLLRTMNGRLVAWRAVFVYFEGRAS